MTFTTWLREKLEAWLGIAELRQKNANLESQLRGLSNLQAENAQTLENQSRRIDTLVGTTNQAVMEAEERLLIRVAALEERLAGHDYTKDEADSPIGGHVPWTERKRRAEQAAMVSDPNKWTKRPAQQEK